MDPNVQTPITQSNPQPPVQPVSPQPTYAPSNVVTKTNWAVSFILLILGLALGASGLWAYQNYLLPKPATEMAMTETSPTPTQAISPLITANPTATPTTDVTSSWQSYTNNIQKVAFKYPPAWELTTSPGDNVNGQIINDEVDLTKDQATIKMIFNLNGIGGRGSDIANPIPITIAGLSLYEFSESSSTFPGSQLVGISDVTKGSFGVFQHNGKVYGFSLTYPSSFNQTTQGQAYEDDFNQILSTFLFIQ